MKFRNDINGIRAIAVFIVVLFHFGVPGFRGGFIGVDVFFVISGFLMTGIICTRLEKNTFSVLGFYVDRGRRIIPALAALCLLLLVFGWFFLVPGDYLKVGKHVTASIGFFSNITYWLEGGYFDNASQEKWLLHTWSLSVEWQFYMLYPIVLVLLKKFVSINRLSLLLIVAAVLSYLLSIIVSEYRPTAAFYLLPSRAWEMLVGGLVFLYPVKLSLVRQKGLESIGLLLIIFSTVVFTEQNVWPGGLAIVPVLGTALIIIATRQDSLFTANPVSAWIGKASYSIYLWHWPIVVALNYYFVQNQLLWICGGIFVSLLLGLLSYHWVECTTKSIGKKTVTAQGKVLKRPNILLILSSLILGIGIIGGLISHLNGVTERVNADVLIADNERNNRNERASECNVYPQSTLQSPKCIYGNSINKIGLIVVGDSHSNAIITAVAASMPNDQGGVLFLGADGCFSLINISTEYFNECHTYNNWVKNELSQTELYAGIPIVIINRAANLLNPPQKTGNVFVNGVRSDSPLFKAEVKSTLKQQVCELTHDNPVYLMQPIPEMASNVPRLLSQQMMFRDAVENITLDLAEYHARSSEIVALMHDIEQSCPITLLDPLPFLCDVKGSMKCRGSIDGRPLYLDENHLSEYGNKFLVPMFELIQYQN